MTNGFEGFILFASNENVFTHNVATNNGGPGVYAGFALLDGSSGNELTANTANTNGDVGFVLEASSDNSLTRNISNANGLTGFEVRAGSGSNLLNRNVAHGNGNLDAMDDRTGSDNSWLDNNFGSTSGI